jgi:hypothetical protein
MSSQANITAQVALVDSKTSLPDGTYDGLWSAYRVTVPCEEHVVELETVEGCRSFDGVPVVVTVVSGVATVEL